MSSQQLQLEQLEFIKIRVDMGNSDEFPKHEVFPKVDYTFDDIQLLNKSKLFYPPADIDDPRVFSLLYGVRLTSKDQKNEVKIPYEIEVEAIAYLKYAGDDSFIGEDRFRAVRFSGYQILHGAIREMVSSLTARGRHGLWILPARNFSVVAKNQAIEDEKQRQLLLLERAESPKIKAKAKVKDFTEAEVTPKPRKNTSSARATSDEMKTKQSSVKKTQVSKRAE